MESHITHNMLPAAIVLLPFVTALLMRPLGRISEELRNWAAVAITATTFLGTVALIPLVAEHHVIGYEIPLLLGEITFRVDSFGMFFALFTSFVWFASTLYAGSYMQHEEKRDRYFTYSLAVLGANMGVVLAGDLVSLYLFFEALGLLAYWLVVHTETPEALKASTKYLWMTVMGGFSLVAGIFIIFGLGSTGAIGPIPIGEGQTVLAWVAAGLMIVGFGVKAGIVPLHIWLPDAHPVAPSPASALLSGIMIKAGAYGIFRVVTALFRPQLMEGLTEEMWLFSTQLGFVVIWIGIATMFIGVVLALLQENAKRMLAYHSVSQMGFIIAGIGVAGYLGEHGAMGFAGGLYHIVNHALFKACLFLGVGAVYFRTHELNMYKLGGLWKKMPFTFLFTLIAACGITGVPIFNGFVSKTLIHHGLVESVEHAAHAAHAAHSLIPAWHAGALSVAEKIYVVTCGGTAASFIKLILFVFLGKPKQDFSKIKEVPIRMVAGMGIIVVPIVALGLMPGLVLDGIIAPGLHTWGLHADILDHFHLFAPGDLMAVVTAFALGGTIVVVGVRYGLFHAHSPAWLSIDYWYRKIAKALLAFCMWLDRVYVAWVRLLSKVLAKVCKELLRAYMRTQRAQRRMMVTLVTGAPGLRRQQCIDTARIIISQERHATVRHAVDIAINQARSDSSMDENAQQQYIHAVRETAMYMATRLFDERINVVAELLRAGRFTPLRSALEKTMPQVKEYREPIAETALRLAPSRVQGDNVLREIAHEMNKIMAAERFDLKIRAAIPTWNFVSQQTAKFGHQLNEALPTQEVLSDYRAGGLTRIESIGSWVVNLSTALMEGVIQQRFPWMTEERIDAWMVGETLDSDRTVRSRLAIQRYTRDMGLNVSIAMIALIFLILMAAVNMP